MSSEAANYKKRQEEAKKKQSGEIAPDVDQDGKMINPHNPDFITKVPWYLGSSGPTLKHHQVQKSDHALSIRETDALINKKIELQRQSAQVNKVFKKGACKNCGATTHKEKDCVERPRSSKKAAWKSGQDIARDDVILNLEEYGKVSFSAKRDQWQGYNPDDYKEVIERHSRLDDIRRKERQEEKERERKEREEELRQRKEAKKEARKAAADKVTAERGDDDKTAESDGSATNSDSDSDYDSDEDDDDLDREFLARDEDARDFQGRTARQGGVGGAEMKTTVRNLRIREDTPKYLRNLALDSAFYDPKARSMRANPFPNENPEDLAFAGDNFVRHTGDALTMQQTQVLCWEMQERGEGIDLISNPSQAELIHKQFREKKKLLEEEKKRAIVEKYGNSYQKSLDPRLKLGQTEAYVEYSKDGRVISGVAQGPTRTKYEEDVFINNHTSVWGSFYSRSRRAWGYACCHSLMKNSYCTGEKGREANDAVLGGQSVDPQQMRKMLEMKPPEKRSAETSFVKRSDIFGESSGGAGLDDAKVKDAMKRYDEWEKSTKEEDTADDRKRGYASMHNVSTTAEDMEAYRLKKLKREDPMAAFAESEELLEYEVPKK
jgi:pre-mRNA-processing factor SLU7